MPKRIDIDLSESERVQLEALIKKGSDWRARDRARTIQLLSDGLSTAEVATQQGYHVETVRKRRRRWLQYGLAGLPDQPRCGAPTKLTHAQRQQLQTWAKAEALNTRQLLSRLKAQSPVICCTKTLHNELKQLGFVWKRTRYSLKKSVIPSDSNKPNAS